jgi:hypothetical protein
MLAEDMDIDTDDSSDDNMVGVEKVGGDVPEPAPLPEGNPSVPNSSSNQPDAAAATTSTAPPSSTGRKPSRTVSIAHYEMDNGQLVLAHVDIETTAGSDKEIIQLSCLLADHATMNIIGEFDEYILPPKDTDWDLRVCQATHGILPNDERIVNALSIKEVWPIFASFCEEAVGADGRVGAIVAWNGKTDLESFFRLTEYTYKDELFMPKGYKYFIDPMACIKTYTGCELNDKKRREGQDRGYALDATYQAAFLTQMDGAHSSIVDVKAQHKIVSDARVKKYLDKNKSVELLTEIWGVKFKRMNAARAEITRPVPVGYTDGGTEAHEPSWVNSYTGPSGGPVSGPSTTALSACNGRDLTTVFLGFIALSLLESVARETNRYGSDEWVRTIDLGQSLIAKGIKMDWVDIRDNTKRPKWLRQQAFLPCSCGLCFFCTNDLTGPTGPPTASPRKHRRVLSPEPNSKHVQLVTERVKVCDGKECGECMRKGKKRKPKAGKEVEGVEYAHRTRLGCPHPICRDHPVCKDCWPTFKHGK